MSDTLTIICEDKRHHVAAQKQHISEAALLEQAKNSAPPRGFHAALRSQVDAGNIGLIAEIKKASPSKGLIRADFDPPSLAMSYEAGGATCLSVLTDVPYFQGDDRYLIAAREAVSLPVLRKDFMLDPYQVAESRALGADCILLIMAALSDAQAAELEAAAEALHMDVLVEVHTAGELERALRLRTQLLGINNRDLKSLEVDLHISEELSAAIPEGYTRVAESGIYTADDIARLRQAGFNCFLIGESLMRQGDVTHATRALLA